ncbi:MAG: WhiB family transcriptional regulator [Actinobacteria bacterium]|nr:WhiB family transcriptional regulator [Actinomycetota bacterium]MCI0678608.1 WhiB family transcriptional regulator [Actinomycetota bacterium]
MNRLLSLLQESGRCTREGSHELFFSDRPTDLAQAQHICGRCPVRSACLQLALQENLEWGVWGGVIFWDGVPYHRRRGRGRPRHADAQLPVEADREELLELVSA